jgi:hypothetical protein
MHDYNIKKDFMVEWIDIKGKVHKTKVKGKCYSATEAAEYIYKTRITCAKFPNAYWI